MNMISSVTTRQSKAALKFFLTKTAKGTQTGTVTTISRRGLASHLVSRCSGNNGNNTLHPGEGLLQQKEQRQDRFEINKQQVRSIYIQQLETPNPESIKFLPTGRLVLDNTEAEGVNGYYVTKNDPQVDILRSPLAKNLFKIEGVKAVYLGVDFVTITKFAEFHWKLMRPQILNELMEFFDTNKPALLEKPEITDTTILEDDDEVVAMIKELMEERIRPAVQEDGGDIRYVGFDFETGVVTVQLAGSCVGCPSSSVTLKQGVENMLMHYIPEVKTVISLEEDEGEGGEGEAAAAAEDKPEEKQQKTYEERLKAAGIPFSD